MSPFLLHVVLPAFFAGSVAVAVTVAIERFGGRIGGLLGTLPTTIVPSSLGMFANDPDVFRDALCIAPAGMLVNALFLWLWRVLPDRLPTMDLGPTLTAMVVLSVTAWAIAASAVLALTHTLTGNGVPPELIGTIATLTILVIGGLACLSEVPTPKGTRHVGLFALIGRGTLAATAIGIALLIAKSGQGRLAGIASVFPAIFLTSMVSVWWSQGRAVSGGAVGPMMLGSASVAVYALIAAWGMPLLGGPLGALVAWIIASFGVTWTFSVWLRRRQESLKKISS